MADMNAALAAMLRDTASDIDAFFDLRLPLVDDPRRPLYAAMRHAAIGGGKRLRPLLVRASSSLFHVDHRHAITVGAAVEAMHVYSLIHDDLPCMDDDDLRRGKPTCHRAFDEATAVLAGDALHALAFEWLADAGAHPDPFVRSDLVLTLARAAGPDGMAGGQMMDLAAETADFDLATISRLQQYKTGALIIFAVEAGAILGKVASDGRRQLLAYGRDIGLAFQIADDILDETGDEALAGKALHKDAAAGKATFVSLMGLDRAREQARLLVDQAVAHLAGYGQEADMLRAIARYVINRER